MSDDSPINLVLSRLGDRKRVKTANGWDYQCPAHEDRKPSLSVSEGDDGKVLLHCQRSCSLEQVLAALHLDEGQLFPAHEPGGKAGSKSRIVKVYSYTDEAGQELFQVCRFAPKDFRQRHRCPQGKDGGFTWNLGGNKKLCKCPKVRLVPYRLVEVLEAAALQGTVFIVEGEKDADNLFKLGLVATTNAQGAGKWRPEFSELLKGASVVIIPDKDEPGHKHASQVAQSLQGKAQSVRVLELPGPGKDASDWIAAGGTRDALLQLLEQGPADEPAAAPAPKPLKRLGDILRASLERAKRRSAGLEKPIPLPWKSLAPHFGGGLWPGLHILNSGTGAGKTQFSLQLALHAAKRGVPVLYVGLELQEPELGLRSLGAESAVPWSVLWKGEAGPAYLKQAEEAIPSLQDTPFHFTARSPYGFPASAVLEEARALRQLYPETNGPGSKPGLVVVDFLQIVADEPGATVDARTRIGQASYALQAMTAELGLSVLCVSSVARERYKLQNDIQATAGLAWDTDEAGRPIKRRILAPDAIVGVGKESGEIEYSADSVSVLVCVPSTWSDNGVDVILATAKGRATGATWSPLHFTKFHYEECEDEGRGVIRAWQGIQGQREAASEQKKITKEQGKLNKIKADVAAVLAYVEAHPGCSVREARINAVGDGADRWKAAVASLGSTLLQEEIKLPKGKKTALSIVKGAVENPLFETASEEASFHTSNGDHVSTPQSSIPSTCGRCGKTTCPHLPRLAVEGVEAPPSIEGGFHGSTAHTPGVHSSGRNGQGHSFSPNGPPAVDAAPLFDESEGQP